MSTLDELLELWRETPAVAIAKAIDAVTVTAEEPLDHAAWLALAREGRSEDVGTLVAHLADGGLGTLSGRVEVLSERPLDPRITMGYAKLALEPPTTSTSNAKVWTSLLPYLKRAADPRVVGLLEKRLAEAPGTSQFWPKFYRALEKIVAATKPAPRLSAAEAKRVAALSKKKPKRSAKKPRAAEPTTIEPTLAGAIAAAKQGDLVACLEALVAVWREGRLGAVGDAIDRVHAIVGGGLPPVSPKEWAAAAAKRSVVDVGRLAESAADGKAGDAEKRLDEMLSWPPDPRIGKALLVAAYTELFADRQRAWRLTTDLVVRNCDPRFGPAAADFQDPRGPNKARASNARRLSRELPAAIAEMAIAPTPADALLLEELDGAIASHLAKGPMTEQRFLADIAAAPDDDGPRLVYADWLTERGHPRGELIVLQCGPETPASAERVAALGQAHPRALMGPATAVGWSAFEYALRSGMVVFERGLLHYLEARSAVPFWLVPTMELLRSLEEMDVRCVPIPYAIALIHELPRLRTLRDVGAELFAELCSQPRTLPITSLRLVHWNEGGDRLEGWALRFAGAGLANLKRLELYWSEGPQIVDRIPDALLASPAMGNVEELTVATTQLGVVLEALARHGRKVRRLAFAQGAGLDYRVVFEDGAASVVPFAAGRQPRIAGVYLATLRRVLDSLPTGTPVTLDPAVTLESPLAV